MSASLSTAPLVECLNELIRHDRAGFELCDAAATRCGSVTPRARMRELGEDHLRRIDGMSQHVRALGGQPTREKAPLIHGRQAVRVVSGDDTLLRAVLEDEAVVADVYHQVHRRDIGLTEVKQAVARAWQQQRQHYRGLSEQLQGDWQLQDDGQLQDTG